MPLGFQPISVTGLGASGQSTTSFAVVDTVTLTGLAATGSVGTISVAAVTRASSFTLPGMLIAVGSVSVTGKANISPVGVRAVGKVSMFSSTASNGVMTVYLAGTVPDGVSMPGQLGDVSVVLNTLRVDVPLAGLQATGVVGVPTIPHVISTYYTDVTVPQMTAQLGFAAPRFDASVVVTGFEAKLSDPIGVLAIPSTFGVDTTFVGQQSLWTPVKPA